MFPSSVSPNLHNWNYSYLNAGLDLVINSRYVGDSRAPAHIPFHCISTKKCYALSVHYLTDKQKIQGLNGTNTEKSSAEFIIRLYFNCKTSLLWNTGFRSVLFTHIAWKMKAIFRSNRTRKSKEELLVLVGTDGHVCRIRYTRRCVSLVNCPSWEVQ